MQIAKDQIFSKLYALKEADAFGINFVKVNGEEREYKTCRMHVKPAYEKKTDHEGVSTKVAFNNNNALKFFCEDVEGYRTCKIDNIRKITIGQDVFEVI